MRDELLGRNDAVRLLHEHLGNLKFLPAERLDFPVILDFVGGAVQHDAAVREQVGKVAALAAQHGTDPGEQF